MAKATSGKRYAQAVFELALEKGDLDSWQASLREIAAIPTDEKLTALLQNPKLSFDAKKVLLEERIGNINSLALNLACLLVHRNKLGIAGDISRQYDILLDTHRDIEHVDIVTALTLDDEDKEMLARRFADIIGHKVVINVKVNPSIIGGIKARIGDTLIDGSVKNKLEALRKNLTEAGR